MQMQAGARKNLSE